MPNVETAPLVKTCPGGPNCVRLNALKNSVRNCKLTLSVTDVSFTIAKSQLLIPGARMAPSVRLSSPKVNSAGAVKHALPVLHVLRDIDDDRPGTPVLRDVKSLVQHARQILDLADQIIMLGAMPGDADRVAFLEGVGADEMGWHLSGDAN